MNLWNMSPLEWFHFLTPIALVLLSLDFVLLLSIDKSAASIKLFRPAIFGYSGTTLGWTLMKIGVSLNSMNMNMLLKVSILGWLILIPMLFFVAVNFLKKLTQPKNKLGTSIGDIFAFSFKFAFKFVAITTSLLFACFARASRNASTATSADYKPNYANPLNETSPGIHQVFPTDFHENYLGKLD